MLQGMIVVVNVPTILILGGTAIRCLNDYVESRKRGENPVFHAKNIGIKEETDSGNKRIRKGLLHKE